MIAYLNEPELLLLRRQHAALWWNALVALLAVAVAGGPKHWAQADDVNPSLIAMQPSCNDSLDQDAKRDERTVNPPTQAFKYEKHDASGGDLNDDSVKSLLVDSQDRVWVGTVTGLARYDGKQWTKRTFTAALPTRVVVGLLTGSTSCGPWHLVEGPPGAIWLGGNFGVWRFHDDYEEVNATPEIAAMIAMAVDRDGDLWVVQKTRVFRYDSKSWRTVLCPYLGKPKSFEATGLTHIAVDAGGKVWIGATAYGQGIAPWNHDGPVWVVDQEKMSRNGGPPMAPLFEFDGNGWAAFGSPQGLNVAWATPKLDKDGNIALKTSDGTYIRDGGIWKESATDLAEFAGKNWVLRDCNKGLLKGYSELLFKDGDALIEVRPSDRQTDQKLDLGLEQLASLRIAEDHGRSCIWVGTAHGLYRIWRQEPGGH